MLSNRAPYLHDKDYATPPTQHAQTRRYMHVDYAIPQTSLYEKEDALFQAAKTFVTANKEQLICTLGESFTIPEDCWRDKNLLTQAIDTLEKRLVYCLADMTRAIMQAEHHTTKDFLATYQKWRPSLGWASSVSFYKASERKERYTPELFYRNFYETYEKNKGTSAVLIKTGAWNAIEEHIYIARYLWPLYVSDHPRYAAQSMVSITNYKHLDNISGNTAHDLSNAVVDKAQVHHITYFPNFFTVPIQEKYQFIISE